jgi:GNAT superfamily N-acetyltransferase
METLVDLQERPISKLPSSLSKLPTLAAFLRHYVIGREPVAGVCERGIRALVPTRPFAALDDQYWIAPAGDNAIVICEGDQVIAGEQLGTFLWVHENHRGRGLGIEVVSALYRHVGPERWVQPTASGRPRVYTAGGLRTLERAHRHLAAIENAK